jgi:hypothetical protein
MEAASTARHHRLGMRRVVRAVPHTAGCGTIASGLGLPRLPRSGCPATCPEIGIVPELPWNRYREIMERSAISEWCKQLAWSAIIEW